MHKADVREWCLPLCCLLFDNGAERRRMSPFLLSALSLLALLYVALFLLLSRWCHWLAHVHASICVLLLLFCWFENLERAQESLVDAHHGPRIVKFTTVIWRREKSDELPLCKELVSIFDDLVRSANQVHVVLLEES